MKEVKITDTEFRVLLGALNVCIDVAKEFLDGYDCYNATYADVVQASQIAAEKVVLERIVNKLKYDDVRD